jgi:hypothetical protein
MNEIERRLTSLFAKRHFKLCFEEERFFDTTRRWPGIQPGTWASYLESIGCKRLNPPATEGFVFIQDPSPFAFGRFIAVPEEMAMKFLVLGMP